MTRALIAAWLLGLVPVQGIAAEPFRLQLPVQCKIGQDCFVQQYTDLDPGPGFRDYRCGQQSYDGHKGIDIRVRSAADVKRGVNVVAAAGGVVKGRRDGMADRVVKSKQGKATLDGKECGNGVVIEHDDGWETQYCHMRHGSVRVRRGERVQAGDVIGKVGYSGAAGFAHLHLSVRHKGKVVDPFRGLDPADKVCGVGNAPLWTPAALSELAYREGQLLDAGFAGGRIALADVEKGSVQGFVPSPQSPALVAWGWAINLKKGDQIFAVLIGPGGEIARHKVTLKSRKAHYVLSTGKKRKGARWPSGRYTAFFGVLRGGEPLFRAGRPFDMP